MKAATMSTLKIDRLESGLAGIWHLLRSEFTPFPGRLEAAWRSVLASAIVIVMAMALQIPFLAFSLIMVFFTAQENTVLTRQSGILFIVGTTISLVLSILLYRFTIDYPLLRLLGTCAIVFCGLYFMRISRWGSYGFIIALMVINLQNLADVSNDPEWLTHGMLWFWVAACYPIVITVAINYLLVPAHPSRLLQSELTRQLGEVHDQLEARKTQTTASLLSLDAIERGILTLHRHLSFAVLGDQRYQQDKALHLMRINTVDRLHTAAAQLSRLPVGAPLAAQRDLISRLQEAGHDLQYAIGNMQTFKLTSSLVTNRLVEGKFDATLQEMAHALQALAEAETAPPSPAPVSAGGLIAADAFSNPVYAQFALKTVLAAMLCYVFYTAAQWRGIQTSMLTCLIMALPSLGATSHKGLLRIVGCVLGSVAALLATVFVIPHLDSLTGLLLLTLPTIAVGSWIAAGSARTSYIGAQFMFAYALASLGGFGPTVDLVEIRDRVIGILLGFAVSIVVFSVIWPEREGRDLRSLLARFLRSIAELARAGAGSGSGPSKQQEIDAARLQGWTLLAKNREMQARVALEPGLQYARDSVTIEMQTWFAQTQEILFAINWMQTLLRHAGPELPDSVMNAFAGFRESAAKRLEQLANDFEDRLSNQDDLLTNSVAVFDQQCAQTQENAATNRIGEIATAVHAIHERITQLGIQFSLPAPQPKK